MKQCHIYSSHGELIANAETGEIVGRVRYDDEDHESDFIARITSFDTPEWHRKYPREDLEGMHLDILDIGYWIPFAAHGGLIYVAPVEEWRAEFRREAA